MKNLTLLFVIVLLIKTTFAQTTIPSGNVSGTWTKTNSPYKIQGEILIPKGSTLTIEPGVVVEFDYGLTVDGVLNAIGKKGDSITFKAGFSVWKGITYYRNTEKDTIVFNFCKFENVVSKLRPNNILGRAIFCGYSSPLKVKNCSFIYNYPYVLVDAPQANCIYSFKLTHIGPNAVRLKSKQNFKLSIQSMDDGL